MIVFPRPAIRHNLDREDKVAFEFFRGQTTPSTKANLMFRSRHELFGNDPSSHSRFVNLRSTVPYREKDKTDDEQSDQHSRGDDSRGIFRLDGARIHKTIFEGTQA